MNYTTNYQLPQWVKEDRIMMEDFNDMAAKVDEALGMVSEDVAAQTAAIAAKGNCQVVYGNYTGTGTSGSAGKTTLQFSKRPLFVVVMPSQVFDDGTTMYRLLLMQGSTHAFTNAERFETSCTVSWSGNSVSWYNYGIADYQCNAQGKQYKYIAFLDASE